MELLCALFKELDVIRVIPFLEVIVFVLGVVDDDLPPAD